MKIKSNEVSSTLKFYIVRVSKNVLWLYIGAEASLYFHSLVLITNGLLYIVMFESKTNKQVNGTIIFP